jgi:hypothetical protein
MISEAALDVLERSTCVGTHVRLPAGQLDRKLYVEVNEVLSRLGGDWKSGKVKAHVFDEDPAPLLATVVDTGEMPPKNPLAFFATPPAVVDRMLELTGPALRAGAVLEPSAGDGAILCPVADATTGRLVAVELDERRAAKLRGGRWELHVGDFLEWESPDLPFSAVVMNPPFTAPGDPLAYQAHIRHAHKMLAAGGTLVAVAPVGFLSRVDRRCIAFREWVQGHGRIEQLPEDAFKESGTGVRCALVQLTAGAEECDHV